MRALACALYRTGAAIYRLAWKVDARAADQLYWTRNPDQAPCEIGFDVQPRATAKTANQETS